MTTKMTALPTVGLVAALALGMTACGSKSDASSSSTTTTTASASSTTAATATTTSATPDAAVSTSPAVTASASDSTSATGSSSSAAAPAGTQQVTGPAYTFAVPTAWKKGALKAVNSQVVPEVNYGVARADGTFLPSLNVQRAKVTAKASDLDDVVQGELTTLAQNNAQQVLRLEDTIDGEKAVGAAGLMKVNGTQVRIRQLATVHQGKLYAISMVLPATASNADAKQQLKQITSTWTWSR